MKTLLILLVLLVPVSVVASDWSKEIDITLHCSYYKTIIGTLLIDYEEVLVFEAQGAETYTAVYVNELTSTWTVVRYDDEKVVACLVDSGVGYNVP